MSRLISDLDSKIQPYVRKFLDEANELTLPWLTFITDGFRTPQEQQALYEQGRSRPGKIVTNAKGLPICQSNHCKRLAVDVAFQRNGKLSYNANLYRKIVPIAKRYGASWGGDWSFPDKPHFEWIGSLPPLDTPPPSAENNTMDFELYQENGKPEVYMALDWKNRGRSFIHIPQYDDLLKYWGNNPTVKKVDNIRAEGTVIEGFITNP